MNLYGEFKDLISKMEERLEDAVDAVAATLDDLKEQDVAGERKELKIWAKGYEAAIEEAKRFAIANAKHYCEDCGKEISDHGKFSAADIMLRAVDVYGKTLCFDCAVNRKKENNK